MCDIRTSKQISVFQACVKLTQYSRMFHKTRIVGQWVNNSPSIKKSGRSCRVYDSPPLAPIMTRLHKPTP